MRESNAARGHKLSRLSISEEAQQDLDLEAKTAEANYQQAGGGNRGLISTGFREFFATILVFVSVQRLDFPSHEKGLGSRSARRYGSDPR
jgi:hypothetical protein